MTTSKTGSLSASTAINIDIWPRNTKQRRKNKRPEHVLNMIKKLEIAKRKQIMKKRKVQKGLDNENEKNEKGFGEDLK